MTEIGSIDSAPLCWGASTEPREDDVPLWEMIGKVELVASGFYFGCSAVYGALKKKGKTVIPAPAPLVSAQAQQWVDPAPVQAPQPVEVKMAEPALEQNDPFSQLPCTQAEQEKVAIVVDRLAKKRYLEPAVIVELRQIEKDLKDLHPLRFLWAVYSKPELRLKVKGTIWKDLIAKNAFLGGINKTMRAKTEAGEIENYLAGFAQAVGSTSDKLLPFIQAGAKARNWKLLVGHLNG